MLGRILISAALMGAALAAPQPAPEPVVEVLEVRQVLSRVVAAATSIVGSGSIANAITSAVAQASTATAGFNTSNLSGCSVPSSILSLLQNGPTPPADLVSALVTVTNPCVKPSFTGSLSSEYDSYSRAASTWASSVMSWQSGYLISCPVASSIKITRTAGICSTGTGAAASGATGAANAGDSQKRAAAGFAAVAGFAGVLALL